MGATKIFLACSLALLAVMTPGTGARAQTGHLGRRITVHFTQVPLENALEEIGKAGDFRFSYNSDLIEQEKRVTVSATDRKVDAVLKDLLGDRVKVKEIGDHVILVQNTTLRPEGKKTFCHVSGIIQEAGTLKALRDVTIYEPGGRNSTLSGPDGRYSVAMETGEEGRTLCFLKHGYYDTVIFFRPTGDRVIRVILRAREPEISRVAKFGGEIDLYSVSTGPGPAIDSLAVVTLLVPRKTLINSLNLRIFSTWPIQLSLIPYIGTNGKVSGSVSTSFSLNLLAGYNGGVKGFELGGLLNIDRNQVRGFQLGGLGNIVGGRTSGFQLGGLFNVDLAQVRGVQVAGLVNSASDTLKGVQLAGLCNYLDTKWRGAQISGLVNISGAPVDGLQLAGLSNITVSQNRGAQIAGFLNYARVLKGFQLAPFNIDLSVESGVPVGFFTYVNKGYHCVEFSADEIFYANVAFKTGTDRFYNIFKAGFGDSLLTNFTYGAGTLFHVGKKFAINLDLTAGFVYGTQNPLTWYGAILKFLVAFEYRPAKHFSLFIGPAFNLSFYSNEGEQAFPNGFPFYNFYDAYHGGTREQMWVGGMAGIRI
jgi:hypothetical protein